MCVCVWLSGESGKLHEDICWTLVPAVPEHYENGSKHFHRRQNCYD